MSEQQQQPNKTPGIISWNELVTRDAAGSTQFYTQLFGWTAEVMDMGPGMQYTFLSNQGAPAGGLMQLPPAAANAPTAWMSYVTVANLDASLAKALSLGAKVCKGVTVLPMGKFAIISDPQGGVVGLWEFAS